MINSSLRQRHGEAFELRQWFGNRSSDVAART
jgi:hypothetical protein